MYQHIGDRINDQDKCSGRIDISLVDVGYKQMTELISNKYDVNISNKDSWKSFLILNPKGDARESHLILNPEGVEKRNTRLSKGKFT